MSITVIVLMGLQLLSACSAPTGGQRNAPVTAKNDFEAYQPDPTSDKSHPKAPDAEGSQPSTDNEATTSLEDWEAYRPASDFELERTAAADYEAYKPSPSFEMPKPGDLNEDREHSAPELTPTLATRPEMEMVEDSFGLALGNTPLERRVTILGRARQMEPGRWGIVDQRTKETLSFLAFIPETTAIALLRSDELRATASRKFDPTGFLEGLALTDNRNLLYLAEISHDTAPLKSSDRDGFAISQIRVELGQPVVENLCYRIYEVPVRVARGAKAIQVRPGETVTFQDGGVAYRVRVLRSTHAVPESCPYSFEGPIRDVHYVIWRVVGSPEKAR